MLTLLAPLAFLMLVLGLIYLLRKRAVVGCTFLFIGLLSIIIVFSILLAAVLSDPNFH